MRKVNIHIVHCSASDDIKDDKTILEAKTMLEVENLMVGKIDDIKKELETKVSSGNYLYDAKYIENALDFESLNKAREEMIEYLMVEMEDRNGK